MEIDQFLLESLPLLQRQKLCKQLRQEQVKRYNELNAEETRKEKNEKKKKGGKKEKKKNRKGRNVKFSLVDILRDATAEFNDREALMALDSGANPNVAGPSGTTLLHKCCMNDNVSMAEILLQRTVDVNARDDDMWTPLHVACECDSPDITQLLLNNGADPLALDIDGNFPIDHASNSSESRLLVQNHMTKLGLATDRLQELRLKNPKQMLLDVQNFIQSGADLNIPNKDGVTLLHIGCANGYGQVVKALLLTGKVDVNVQDKDGWTPLHVAAKYCQSKIVHQLLKCDGDPHKQTFEGQKPSQLAGMDKIQKMLRKAEQQTADAGDNEDDEVSDDQMAATRINSKVIQPRHESLSKKEELLEARRWKPSTEEVERDKQQTQARLGVQEDSEEDSDNENIYVNISLLKKPELPAKKVELPVMQASDNLASLSEITEQIILSEIKKRYLDNQIYTYVGDILIACNPFKTLTIYNRMISRKYQESTKSAMPPHIYSIAEDAYTAMLREGVSQCCIISGESGAGKTESFKYLLQHILQTAQSEEQGLNKKIHQVNPLLEAFGNAQTIMNDNSSRFGKYIEMKFSAEGFVQGAKITEYLLEKSRVVSHGKNEKNFHIFYLMLAGMSPDQYKMLGLDSSDKHRYLNNNGADVKSLLTSEKRESFQEIIECMRSVGFAQDDVDHLMSTIAAILLLGDIRFKPVGNNDAAKISNPELVRKVSGLLQLPMGELDSALISEVTITRGEQIKKERTVVQAQDCTDALAKALYGRLFSWIVNGVNQLIQPVEESEPSEVEIGVLDIFGFENFSTNSFEQICINLANEQLQNYFNKFIFEREQEDCLNEGISLVDITFTSNQSTVDLFLVKHTGLFSILDEESRFPKATDKSLAIKLHSGPGKKCPSLYLAPKDGGTTFAVMHYAGKVQYSLVGVLDKNRDTLPNSILFTMKSSNSLLVKDMFQSRMTRTGSLAPSTRQQKSRKITDTKGAFEFFQKRRQSKGKSRVFKPRSKRERPVLGTERKGALTVAYHFKNSLADLMNKMNSATPHFIRCIKPNMSRTAGNFETQYALAQLRYTGVMETIKIRRQGYSMRLSCDEFIERYEIICLCALPKDSPMSSLQKCKQALQYCNLDNYKVGKTKLFFRYWHVEKLDQLSTSLEKKVLTTQKVIRGWIERCKFGRILERKKMQDGYIKTFFINMTEQFAVYFKSLQQQREHDDDRKKLEMKEEERRKEELKIKEEARISIKGFDTMLEEYEKTPSDQEEDTETMGRKISIRDLVSPPTPNEAADTIATLFSFPDKDIPATGDGGIPKRLLHGRQPSYKLPPPPDNTGEQSADEVLPMPPPPDDEDQDAGLIISPPQGQHPRLSSPPPLPSSIPSPPPFDKMPSHVPPPPPPMISQATEDMKPLKISHIVDKGDTTNKTSEDGLTTQQTGHKSSPNLMKKPPPVAPKPKPKGGIAVFPVNILEMASSKSFDEAADVETNNNTNSVLEVKKETMPSLPPVAKAAPNSSQVPSFSPPCPPSCSPPTTCAPPPPAFAPPPPPNKNSSPTCPPSCFPPTTGAPLPPAWAPPPPPNTSSSSPPPSCSPPTVCAPPPPPCHAPAPPPNTSSSPPRPPSCSPPTVCAPPLPPCPTPAPPQNTNSLPPQPCSPPTVCAPPPPPCPPPNIIAPPPPSKNTSVPPPPPCLLNIRASPLKQPSDCANANSPPPPCSQPSRPALVPHGTPIPPAGPSSGPVPPPPPPAFPGLPSLTVPPTTGPSSTPPPAPAPPAVGRVTRSPPQPATIPNDTPSLGGLLAGIANVKLKRAPVLEEEKQIKSADSPDSHTALIAQIHTGVKLKRSPGPKIKEIHKDGSNKDKEPQEDKKPLPNFFGGRKEVPKSKQSPAPITLAKEDDMVQSEANGAVNGSETSSAPSIANIAIIDGNSSWSSSSNGGAVKSPPLSTISSGCTSPQSPPPPIKFSDGKQKTPTVPVPPKMPGAAGPANTNLDKINKLPIVAENAGGIPVWKKEMQARKRKEQEKIDEVQTAHQIAEEERWAKIPVWQRPLVRKREEEKRQIEEEDRRRKELETEKKQKVPWKFQERNVQPNKIINGEQNEKKLLKEDEEKWMKIVNKNKMLDENS